MSRGSGGNPYFRDLSRPPPGYSTHQHLNHRDHHPRHQLQRRNQNQFDQRNYHQSQFSQDGDYRNFERQSFRGTDERRHEDLRRQGSGGRRDDPRGKPSRWDRQNSSSSSRNNSLGREGCDYRGKNNSNDRNGSSSTFPPSQVVTNTKKKPSETVTSHSSSASVMLPRHQNLPVSMLNNLFLLCPSLFPELSSLKNLQQKSLVQDCHQLHHPSPRKLEKLSPS